MLLVPRCVSRLAETRVTLVCATRTHSRRAPPRSIALPAVRQLRDDRDCRECASVRSVCCHVTTTNTVVTRLVPKSRRVEKTALVLPSVTNHRADVTPCTVSNHLNPRDEIYLIEDSAT